MRKPPVGKNPTDGLFGPFCSFPDLSALFARMGQIWVTGLTHTLTRIVCSRSGGKPPFSTVFDAQSPGFLPKSGALWSYWPDLNRRPADYERSSELLFLATQGSPALSAGCFARFGGVNLVSAPLIPSARFRVWVTVWV